MTQPLDRLRETPSQTAGPYVHIGCLPNWTGIPGVFPWDLGCALVDDETRGERITIRGSTLDGSDTPLRDAMIEIWQADADGVYPGGDARGLAADPHFAGWGRQAGDREIGEWAFETIKPGRVPFRDGRWMAPHVSFWIVARGINIGLHTRMYFPDEQAANAEDPVLGAIEHRVRVPTLIAEKTGEGEYRFDIRLQGERETVFFDI